MATLPDRLPDQRPDQKPDLEVLKGGKQDKSHGPRRRGFIGRHRTLGGLLLAAGVVIGGGGLIAVTHQGGGGPGTSETPSPTGTFLPPSESPSGTPTERSTTSPPPTEVPTPVPTGYEQEGNSIIWYADYSGAANRGEKMVVPSVEGLTAKVVDGRVEYFRGNELVGIFCRNFALVEADQSLNQTGIVMLTGAEAAKHLTNPNQMPLPFAVNEASGVVILGYDSNGWQGNSSKIPSRAVVNIPSGSTVHVSEFNPQNGGEVLGLQNPDLNYAEWDPTWQTNSSPLSRVNLFGTGNGTTTESSDIQNHQQLPMGNTLLQGVSGESSIQRSDTNGNWLTVDSSLFATNSDGTMLGVLPNGVKFATSHSGLTSSTSQSHDRPGHVPDRSSGNYLTAAISAREAQARLGRKTTKTGRPGRH